MQKHLSDLTLWRAFLAGDKNAFAEIYNLYSGELLSYGYRITGNKQLIRDCIHSLFLHIWEHRENLSETDSIRFYLFRSLRNLIQQKKNSVKSEFFLEDISMAAPSEISFEQLIIEEEGREKQLLSIRKAIQSLPPRQQEIIQLRYYHNMGTDEIAELMEINNQSVRNLLYRSISHLRAFFESLPKSWMASLLLLFGG